MRKSATLQCSAININKNVTSLNYQWQKESVDIKNAQSQTYTTNVPGSYRCKITNGYTIVYTQDAILSKEPVWVTGIIINTQSITNSGKIQYTINPEQADNKTITFDEVTTSDYSISSEGIVNIKNNCNFEVVARSHFGKDYSEIIGKGNIVGTVIIPISLITIVTNTICDAGQIETYVTPVNADIVKKQFDIMSGSEYVEMDETGYIYEVHTPGVINVSVSGFDKLNNIVCNNRTINCINKYIKLSGVIITSDTIYKNVFIEYTTTPFAISSELSSVKFEIVSGTDVVNIDEDTGKVLNVFKTGECVIKLTVVDNYGTTIITQKTLNCIILVENIVITKTTVHNSGKISYTISPQNASNKTVNFKFKTSTDIANITKDGFITVMTNGSNILDDDVVNVGDVIVVGEAQDGSGVTGEATIHLTKTPDTIYISSVDFNPTTITDEGIISVTYSPLNATVSEFDKIDYAKLFAINGDDTSCTVVHNKTIRDNGILDTYKIIVLKQSTECVGVASVNINNKLITTQHQLTLIKTIPVTSITVRDQTITDSGTVAYIINPSNATNKTVKFELASTSNATIDSSTGKLTVKSNGSVKVIVKAQDGSGVTGEATITLIKTQRIINPSSTNVLLYTNVGSDGASFASTGTITKYNNKSKIKFDWDKASDVFKSQINFQISYYKHIMNCGRLAISPNISWNNTNYTSLSGKGKIIIPNFYTGSSTSVYPDSGPHYGNDGCVHAYWCLNATGNGNDNKSSYNMTGYTTPDGYTGTLPIYDYAIAGDSVLGEVQKDVIIDFNFNVSNIQSYKRLKFVLAYRYSFTTMHAFYDRYRFIYMTTTPVEITMENCEYVLY